MATAKQGTPRKSPEQPISQVRPMPFPGESPTVSLALAAGQKYGLHEEEEKPAPSRKARSRPKRKAGAPGAKKAAPKKTASKKAPRKKARG